MSVKYLQSGKYRCICFYTLRIKMELVGCIVVYRYFNSLGHIMAIGDAHVIPGFLTPVLTQLSFQSHRLLISYAAAEVRGEKTPERKFASTRPRTHNHQVMSPTRSLLDNRPGHRKFDKNANVNFPCISPI